MPITINVIEHLRQLPLLDAAQKETLSQLEAEFPKPRDLVQELIRRNWLTFYQGSQLLLGNGADLALGQYVLLDKVGEGGMGQVYKARQRNLDRIVALKVIRKECLSNPTVLQRFQREIRASGHLSHPNIVRAYDADQANGTYFIAMEFIDGVDLAKMVKDSGPLPVDQACEFIRQAALGLQHAHERSLVHRDIKPANLLVSRSQESGVRGQETGNKNQGSAVKRIGSGVRKLAIAGKSQGSLTPDSRPLTPILKILDLGLARWDDAATGRASTHLTQMGLVMGTPDFISPEQARNSHTCDIRADLYSLGCTLYYILTGRVPFLGNSFTEKLIQHQVDDPEPVAPVRRAMLISFHTRQGATKIPRKLLTVPDDVWAIIKKLMAKKPEDRFQTPGELAQALDDALQRMAGGNQAKPSDATECESLTPIAAVVEAATLDTRIVKVDTVLRLHRPAHPKRRWDRRRWLTFGGVAASVFFALVLASLGGQQAKPQAGDAEIKKAPSGADDREAWKALQAEVQRHSLPPTELRAKLLDFKRQHPARANDVAALFPRIASPFDAFDRTKIDVKQWYAWMPEEIVAIRGMSRGFLGTRSSCSVAVSPDARLIVGSDGLREIRLWDTTGTGIPWTILNPTWSKITRVAISPNGVWLATASEEGSVRVYDIKTHKLLHTFEKAQRATTCLALHPDSNQLAAAGNDGVVRLWTIAAGAKPVEIDTTASKINALSFTPDGKYIVWGGDNQEVQWADRAGQRSQHWRRTVNTGPLRALAFHPDHHTLVCGGGDGTLQLCSWDGHKASLKASLDKHAKPVNDAAFAPDGLTFATAGDDMQLILWDAVTGAVKKSYELRFPIHAVAWAPDSRHLLTANANGTVYIFRMTESTALAQAKQRVTPTIERQ